MFTCVLCVAALRDHLRTAEHVFPASLGGTLVMHELCPQCNSHLGHAVDAALVNNQYIAFSRRNLGLSGKSGRIPNPLPVGYVGGDASRRVRWLPDGQVRAYPHERTTQDGRRLLIVDPTDADRLPAMLDKIRSRGDGHAAIEGRVERPEEALAFDLRFDATPYQLGLIKIVYELAYLVLGSAYLRDPIAWKFRSLLRMARLNAEELDALGLKGTVRGLCTALLPLRAVNESALVGLVYPEPGSASAFAHVRVFDRFDATFLVTERADAYPMLPPLGLGWIIDVPARRHREVDRSVVGLA